MLIIGEGPQRREIERQIAELELTGHAVIAGHRNDVRPYIACCDVMTLTSHNVETFSIAALESMALGKPLVLRASAAPKSRSGTAATASCSSRATSRRSRSFCGA